MMKALIQFIMNISLLKKTISNQNKEIEDDDNDALNYRIKYKIELYYLSGVGCEQDIDNGYRKIVEAENFHLPDAKSWINKYGEEKDHGAEVAKILLYKDEYDKVIQNLNNQYKNEKNKSEYVRLGLASYCIRRKMFDEALNLLNKSWTIPRQRNFYPKREIN
ncbi:hypothetical protein C2G38_2031968 [Gigaspora rosea]|uniref:Uncharacterized protein n=1 Tax=Gigaspora rosea TaxID=44941 RepID=A0A397VRA8_9GLOM|nr:hypothetical protein C2G38_2031968 [Gigaspora rosea]